MIQKRSYPQRKRSPIRRCAIIAFLIMLTCGSLAYGYYQVVVAAEVPVLEAARGVPVVPGHDMTLSEYAEGRTGKKPAPERFEPKEEVPVPERFKPKLEVPVPERIPSPWFGSMEKNGNPFADQPIKMIAAALSQKYKDRKPVEWAEHFTGITSTLWQKPVPESNAPPVIALTLDACGGKKGSGFDAQLIAFLRENSIPATLFITSTWAKANPKVLQELAADPLFEIAGHGLKHRPASINGNSVYGIRGTNSFYELVAEVEGNMRDLTQATGTRPRWYRSGTAYYDDIAVSVIHDLGLGIGGYSIAGDEGATLPAEAVTAKTLAAEDGDILLFHMNRPKGGTRDGLKKALPILKEKGFQFVRLSELVK